MRLVCLFLFAALGLLALPALAAAEAPKPVGSAPSPQHEWRAMPGFPGGHGWGLKGFANDKAPAANCPCGPQGCPCPPGACPAGCPPARQPVIYGYPQYQQFFGGCANGQCGR